MKKICLLFSMLTLSVCVLAQKKYLTIEKERNWNRFHLSGDIPSDMKSEILYTDVVPTNTPQYGASNEDYMKWIGILLNKLAEKGFVVEHASSTYYLLSRTSDGGTNRIAKVVSDDEDVYEVARYNLQGMPIPKTEKGIQIIVYSNYTTKTVIVE